MLAIGPPGCLHCSLSTDHYPLSTLSRCARRHIPHCQGNVSVRSGIRHKQHAGAGGTGGNAVGQGLLHGAAHLAAQLPVPAISYGKEGDGISDAHNLCTVLRELDRKGAKTVYARCPLSDGVSMAVYNRLIRAAAFRVVEV